MHLVMPSGRGQINQKKVPVPQNTEYVESITYTRYAATE